MNQERMRCILFQRSEWPMGVGLSSKHWALRSHSFSAERARRAGESPPPSASRRRVFFFFPPLRAQIPRNNKLEPELKLHSPQILEEEKVLDNKLPRVLIVLFVSPPPLPRLFTLFFFVFILQLFLRDFYNWVVLLKDRPPKCAAVLRVPSLSLLHQRAPPWIYFVFILGRMHA